LVGEGVNASFDKKTFKRLQDIHKLDADIQEKLFFFIDTVIRDTKCKEGLRIKKAAAFRAALNLLTGWLIL